MSWRDLEKEKPKVTNSIDGYIRPAEQEQILNKHFANTFKSDEAKEVLDTFNGSEE